MQYHVLVSIDNEAINDYSLLLVSTRIISRTSIRLKKSIVAVQMLEIMT